MAPGDFSVSFWYIVKDDKFQPMVGKSDRTSNTGYSAWVASATVGGDMDDFNDGWGEVTRPAGDDTTFQQVVIQNNGGTLEFYVNGTQKWTAATSGGTDAPGAFAIANRSIDVSGNETAESWAADVTIDEVWIFDRALTTDEIADLRDMNTPPAPQSANSSWSASTASQPTSDAVFRTPSTAWLVPSLDPRTSLDLVDRNLVGEAAADVLDELLTIVSTDHLASSEPSRSENHPTRLATESTSDASENAWNEALLDILEQDIN